MAKINQKNLSKKSFALVIGATSVFTIPLLVSADIDNQSKAVFLNFHSASDYLNTSDNGGNAYGYGLLNGFANLKIKGNTSIVKPAKVNITNWIGRSPDYNGTIYADNSIGNRNFFEKSLKTLGYVVSTKPENAIVFNDTSFLFNSQNRQFRQMAKQILVKINELVQNQKRSEARVNSPTNTTSNNNTSEQTKIWDTLYKQVKDTIDNVVTRIDTQGLTGAGIDFSSLYLSREATNVPNFLALDFENNTVGWIQALIFTLKNASLQLPTGLDETAFQNSQAYKDFQSAKDKNLLYQARGQQSTDNDINLNQSISSLFAHLNPLNNSLEVAKVDDSKSFTNSMLISYDSNYRSSIMAGKFQESHLATLAPLIDAFLKGNQIAPFVPAKEPVIVAYHSVLQNVYDILARFAVDTNVNIDSNLASDLANAIVDYLNNQAIIAKVSVNTLIAFNSQTISEAIYTALTTDLSGKQSLSVDKLAQNLSQLKLTAPYSQTSVGNLNDLQIFKDKIVKASQQNQVINFLMTNDKFTNSDNFFKLDKQVVNFATYLKAKLKQAGYESATHIETLHQANLSQLFTAIQQDLNTQVISHVFNANTNVFLASQNSILEQLNYTYNLQMTAAEREFANSGSISEATLHLLRDLDNFINDIKKVSYAYSLVQDLLSHFELSTQTNSKYIEDSAKINLALNNFEVNFGRNITRIKAAISDSNEDLLNQVINSPGAPFRNNNLRLADTQTWRNIGTGIWRALKATFNGTLALLSLDLGEFADSYKNEFVKAKNYSLETQASGTKLVDLLKLQGIIDTLAGIEVNSLLAHSVETVLHLLTLDNQEFKNNVEEFIKKLIGSDISDLTDLQARKFVVGIIGQLDNYIRKQADNSWYLTYHSEQNKFDNLKGYLAQVATIKSVFIKFLQTQSNHNTSDNATIFGANAPKIVDLEIYSSDNQPIATKTSQNSTFASSLEDYDSIYKFDLKNAFLSFFTTKNQTQSVISTVYNLIDSWVANYYNEDKNFVDFATLAYQPTYDLKIKDNLAVFEDSKGVFVSEKGLEDYKNALIDKFSQLITNKDNLNLTLLKSTAVEQLASGNISLTTESPQSDNFLPITLGSPLNQLQFKQIASNLTSKQLTDQEITDLIIKGKAKVKNVISNKNNDFINAYQTRFNTALKNSPDLLRQVSPMVEIYRQQDHLNNDDKSQNQALKKAVENKNEKAGLFDNALNRIKGLTSSANNFIKNNSKALKTGLATYVFYKTTLKNGGQFIKNLKFLKNSAKIAKLGAKATRALGFGVGLIISSIISGIINYLAFDTDKAAGYWIDFQPELFDSIVPDSLGIDEKAVADNFNHNNFVNPVKIINTPNFSEYYDLKLASDTDFLQKQVLTMLGSNNVKNFEVVGSPEYNFASYLKNAAIAKTLVKNKKYSVGDNRPGTSTLYYDTINSLDSSFNFETPEPSAGFAQLASKVQTIDFGLNFDTFVEHPISQTITISALNAINNAIFTKDKNDDIGAYGGAVNINIKDLYNGVTSLAVINNSNTNWKNDNATLNQILDKTQNYLSFYQSDFGSVVNGYSLTQAEKSANASARSVSWVPIFGSLWAESKRNPAAAFALDYKPSVAAFGYMPSADAYALIKKMNGSGNARQSLWGYSSITLKLVRLNNGNVGLQVIQNIFDNNIKSYTYQGAPLEYHFVNSFNYALLADKSHFDKDFLTSAINQVEKTIDSPEFEVLAIDENSDLTNGSNLQISLEQAARQNKLIIFDNPLGSGNTLVTAYTARLKNFLLKALAKSSTQISNITGQALDPELLDSQLELVKDIDITSLQILPYYDAYGNIKARIAFNLDFKAKYNNANVVITFLVNNTIYNGGTDNLNTLARLVNYKPVSLRVANVFLLKKVLVDSLKIKEYNIFSQSNYDLLQAYQDSKQVDPRDLQKYEKLYFDKIKSDYELKINDIKYNYLYNELDTHFSKLELQAAYKQADGEQKTAVINSYYNKLLLEQKYLLEAKINNQLTYVKTPSASIAEYRKIKFASDSQQLEYLAVQLGMIFYQNKIYESNEELLKALDKQENTFNIDLVNPFSFEVYDNRDLNIAAGGYVEFVNNFKGTRNKSINIQGNKVVFAFDLNNLDNQEQIYYNEYKKVANPYQIIYHLRLPNGKSSTITINFVLPDLTVGDLNFKNNIPPELKPIYDSQFLNIKALPFGKSIDNLTLDDVANAPNLDAIFGNDPDKLAAAYFSDNAKDAVIQQIKKSFDNQARIGDTTRFASFIVANPFYVFRNKQSRDNGVIGDTYVLKSNSPISELHYQGSIASTINSDIPFFAQDITYLFDNNKILKINDLPRGSQISYFATNDANTPSSKIETTTYNGEDLFLDFSNFANNYSGLYKLSITIPSGKNFVRFNKLVFLSPNNASSVKSPLTEVNTFLKSKGQTAYFSELNDSQAYAQVAPFINKDNQQISAVALNELYRNYSFTKNKKIISSFKYQNLASLARKEFIKVDNLIKDLDIYKPDTLAKYNDKFVSATVRNNDIIALQALIKNNELNLQTQINSKNTAAEKNTKWQSQLEKLTQFQKQDSTQMPNYSELNAIAPLSPRQYRQMVVQFQLHKKAYEHLNINGNLIEKIQNYLNQETTNDSNLHLDNSITTSSTEHTSQSTTGQKETLDDLQKATALKFAYDNWQKTLAQKQELGDFLEQMLDMFLDFYAASFNNTSDDSGTKVWKFDDNINVSQVTTVKNDSQDEQELSVKYTISNFDSSVDPQMGQIIVDFIKEAQWSFISNSVTFADSNIETIIGKIFYLQQMLYANKLANETKNAKELNDLINGTIDSDSEQENSENNNNNINWDFTSNAAIDYNLAKFQADFEKYDKDPSIVALHKFFAKPKELESYNEAQTQAKIDLLYKYNLVFSSLGTDIDTFLKNQINLISDNIANNSFDYDSLITDIQTQITSQKNKLASLEAKDKLFMQTWFDELIVKADKSQTGIDFSDYVTAQSGKNFASNKDFLTFIKNYIKEKNIKSVFLDTVIAAFTSVEDKLEQLTTISSNTLPTSSTDIPALVYLSQKLNQMLSVETSFSDFKQLWKIDSNENNNLDKFKITGFINSIVANGRQTEFIIQTLVYSSDKSVQKVVMFKFAYDKDVEYYVLEPDNIIQDGKWLQVLDWNESKASVFAKIASNQNYILRYTPFDNHFIVSDLTIKKQELASEKFVRDSASNLTTLSLAKFNALFATPIFTSLGQYAFLLDNIFNVTITEQSTNDKYETVHYLLTNQHYRIELTIYYADKPIDKVGQAIIYQGDKQVADLEVPTILKSNKLELMNLANLSNIISSSDQDISLIDDIVKGKRDSIIFDNSQIAKLLQLLNLRFSSNINGFFAPIDLNSGGVYKNYLYRLTFNTNKNVDYIISDALGYLFLNLKLEVFAEFATPFISKPFVLAIKGVQTNYDLVNLPGTTNTTTTNLNELINNQINAIKYNYLYYRSQYLPTYLDNAKVLNWKAAIFFALNYYPYLSKELATINNTDENLENKVNWVWQYILNHKDLPTSTTFQQRQQFLLDSNLFSTKEHIPGPENTTIDFVKSTIYQASHYNFEKTVALADISFNINFVDPKDEIKAQVQNFSLENSDNPFSEFNLTFQGQKRYVGVVTLQDGEQVKIKLITSTTPIDFNLRDLLTLSEQKLGRDSQNKLITSRLATIKSQFDKLIDILKSKVIYNSTTKSISLNFSDNVDLSISPIYRYDKNALVLVKDFLYQPKKLLFDNFDGTRANDPKYVKEFITLKANSPLNAINSQFYLKEIKNQENFKSYIYEIISDNYEPSYLQINTTYSDSNSSDSTNVATSTIDIPVSDKSDKTVLPSGTVQIVSGPSYSPTLFSQYNVISTTSGKTAIIGNGKSLQWIIPIVIFATFGLAGIGWFVWNKIRTRRKIN